MDGTKPSVDPPFIFLRRHTTAISYEDHSFSQSSIEA